MTDAQIAGGLELVARATHEQVPEYAALVAADPVGNLALVGSFDVYRDGTLVGGVYRAPVTGEWLAQAGDERPVYAATPWLAADERWGNR